MRTIFNVRRPDGKLAAQCSSRAHVEREIDWWRKSGPSQFFTVEELERDGMSYWGIGAPRRFVGRWPNAKLDEFRERYGHGEPIKDLAEYFDTSFVCICKRARELGFINRMDDPANFEKHCGRWTEREERLINFMYDEAMPIGAIATNIPRTKGAITQRLRDTASALSERSKFGRFVRKPGSGYRAISPVLEETGGSYGDGD